MSKYTQDIQDKYKHKTAAGRAGPAAAWYFMFILYVLGILGYDFGIFFVYVWFIFGQWDTRENHPVKNSL